MLTSPVSRVLTSALGSRLFESRLCTYHGPVIDLPYTYTGYAPDHDAIGAVPRYLPARPEAHVVVI